MLTLSSPEELVNGIELGGFLKYMMLMPDTRNLRKQDNRKNVTSVLKLLDISSGGK
jgi:hypothetical protein